MERQNLTKYFNLLRVAKSKWLLLLIAAVVWAGCKKGVNPVALGTSQAGQLSRYDLTAADYDITPVTTFTASYNQGSRLANLFQKTGQTLTSYNLNYEGDKLSRAISNTLAVQMVSYNAAGKPARIDYTTLTDTGRITYTYNPAGKLISMVDSVKRPLAFPARRQYLYTYDAAGQNVIQITENQLDLQGRPTTKQYSYFTFDDKQNPFTAFPLLQSTSLLPGNVPATGNKNNITSAHLVSTILNPSSPGSVPVYDTVTIYRTTRSYQYNDKGYPVKAIEKFNNVQYNYSGNRTFTYEY